MKSIVDELLFIVLFIGVLNVSAQGEFGAGIFMKTMI